MLYSSYTDLINAVNKGVEPGEEPVVQSRYPTVTATTKHTRQIIAGEEPTALDNRKKPLSMAVEELCELKVRIVSDEDSSEEEDN